LHKRFGRERSHRGRGDNGNQTTRPRIAVLPCKPRPVQGTIAA
jgi:hypothetical protein